MRRALSLALALAVAACATQRKTTVTQVYGPYATSVQAPQPPPEKIKFPLSIRITSFVGGIFGRVFSIFPHKKRHPAANPPPWVGTVRLVNGDARFVLIDGISLNAAQPGDTLITITDHSESATLRMSNLTDPPFVIADIIGGKPQVGDKVYAPKKTLQQ